jgi:hypothetical protein
MSHATVNRPKPRSCDAAKKDAWHEPSCRLTPFTSGARCLFYRSLDYEMRVFVCSLSVAGDASHGSLTAIHGGL